MAMGKSKRNTSSCNADSRTVSDVPEASLQHLAGQLKRSDADVMENTEMKAKSGARVLLS